MSHRTYLVRYLVLFVLAGFVAGMSYRASLDGIGVLQCPALEAAGTFLANCSSKFFGDYEHGAYYLGLEPEAIAYLRQAKVLFLGNSRAQFAFSADTVKAYFDNDSVSHYVLAFNAEQAWFAQALISKEQLSPKVLVIVADPFFSRYWLSPPAVAVMGQGQSFWQRFAVWQDYLMKKVLIRIRSRAICRLGSFVCPKTNWDLYRSFKDGAWLWGHGKGTFGGNLPEIPIEPARRKYYDKANASADLKFASEFLQSAHAEAKCVVLTVVPNSEVDADDYAREIGRLLGANTILPQLEGLTTFDGSHLSWPSAQRWSAALMREADPIIKSCATAKTVSRQKGVI